MYETYRGTVETVAPDTTTINSQFNRVYVRFPFGPFGIYFTAHESVKIDTGDTVSVFAEPVAKRQLFNLNETLFVSVELAPGTGIKFHKRGK